MSDFQTRYVAARRAAIEQEYPRLNPEQRRAVLATEGPLLLLAGAGSGKTTVLIHRIANLLTFGRGSDCDEIPRWAGETQLHLLEQYAAAPTPALREQVLPLCAVEPAAPWSVLAITFTNKAARELRERLERMLGEEGARDIWASTFHSACVRILRRDIEHLPPFSKDFTIYDTDDSKRLLKEIARELNLEEKSFSPRDLLSAISNAKNAMLSPEDFASQAEAQKDWRRQRIAGVYLRYVRRLREANALDFDDIILHTVTLLQSNSQVRSFYQNKFRYVLIDEYQDTNHAQYLLARLLADGRKNLCVVGDDDQSIYRFRGADITNILNFERDYHHARTIRLEQNYRSTANILNAANGVIRNNEGRKGKTLWTEQAQGEPVTVKTVFNENDEANYVVNGILSAYHQGRDWKDNAVLYRMNAQSNALENALRRNGIPYQVVGGHKFFDRAEVKDMLSYLCVLQNPADDLRLRRIINSPARGIGATTVERVQEIASGQGVCCFEIIRTAQLYPELRSAAPKLLKFADLIQTLRELGALLSLPEFYEAVCDKSGYLKALEEKNDQESLSRLENVRELKSSILGFLENGPEDPTLAGFLNEVALFTDLDQENNDGSAVTLMTMHSAKGLEFPAVYVVGVEDGLFPGNRAMSEPEEMEEERRLCYVAMTRAREKLTLTCARQRMLFGRTQPAMPSRFLKELPAQTMQWLGKPEPRPAADYFDDQRETAASTPQSFGGGFGGSWGEKRTVDRGMSNYSKSAAAAPKAGAPASSDGRLMELSVGERVEHRAFGRGSVLAVTPMGGDALVEIDFEGKGKKKLMLKTAGVHMKKL